MNFVIIITPNGFILFYNFKEKNQWNIQVKWVDSEITYLYFIA